jgi:hypothetical protein
VCRLLGIFVGAYGNTPRVTFGRAGAMLPG